MTNLIQGDTERCRHLESCALFLTADNLFWLRLERLIFSREEFHRTDIPSIVKVWCIDSSDILRIPALIVLLFFWFIHRAPGDSSKVTRLIPIQKAAVDDAGDMEAPSCRANAWWRSQAGHLATWPQPSFAAPWCILVPLCPGSGSIVP